MDNNNPLDFLVGDYCRVQLCPGANDFLIAFSGANTPAGKFNYTRSLSNLSINKIFLNCRAEDYYHFGIPGVGQDIEETISTLRDIVQKNSPEIPKVYTMGCSMGGYGALIYGALLNASRVLAFGASVPIYSEFLCARSDRQSHLAQFSHLAEKLSGCHAEKYLFYGDRTLSDILSIKKFRQLNAAEYRFLPFYPHAVIAPISEQIDISELVQSLINFGVQYYDGFLPVSELPGDLDKDYDYLFDGAQPDGLASLSQANELSMSDVGKCHYTILYALGVGFGKSGNFELSMSLLRASLRQNFSARTYKRILDISSSVEDYVYLIAAVQAAFKAGSAALFETSEFDLLVKSYESACSKYSGLVEKVCVTHPEIKGFYDGSFVDATYGWCVGKNGSCIVEVSVNDLPIGQVECDRYRKDLDSADKNFGNCAFLFPFDLYELYLNSEFSDEVALVALKEKSSGSELINSGVHIKVPLIYCHLDSVFNGVISGWVVNGLYGESRVRLDLFVEGEFVRRITPDVERGDLQSKGYAIKSGFSVDLKKLGFSEGVYNCALRLAGFELLVKPDFLVSIK